MGRRLLPVLVLLALAAAAYQARRALIRSFFVDGRGGPAPRLTGAGEEGLPLPPAVRVRVVLFDGLGRAQAATLPALNGLCASGLDLVVDMGFPTVSLPVQRVLWTGATQQQSGVQYRIGRIAPPLAASLPGQVPGSTAVAESHQEIVHSFAFTRALPPLRQDDAAAARWTGGGFAAAARALAAGHAPLGFVHVLRIDEAGHREGAASAAYAEAATWADGLLASLLEADRRAHPAGGTAWLVLADHGHRGRGGHGDAEEAVRLVRACLAGTALPPAAGGRLHLIDLARALRELCGVAPAPGLAGRPLSLALAQPDPGATLPWPSPVTGVLAALLALVALGTGLRAVPRAWAAPLWWPVALATVTLLHGPPTLSSRVIYPPQGRDMVLAAAPGLLLLLGTLSLGLRRASLPHLLVAQLALPLGAAIGLLFLCNAPVRLLGLSLEPPLVPYATGAASLLLQLCFSGCLAAALPSLAAAVRAPSGPWPRAGSGGTAA